MSFNYNNNNYLSLDATWVSSLHLDKKDSECNSMYGEFCAILPFLHVPTDAVVLCFIRSFLQQLGELILLFPAFSGPADLLSTLQSSFTEFL